MQAPIPVVPHIPSSKKKLVNDSSSPSKRASQAAGGLVVVILMLPPRWTPSPQNKVVPSKHCLFSKNMPDVSGEVDRPDMLVLSPQMEDLQDSRRELRFSIMCFKSSRNVMLDALLGK